MFLGEGGKAVNSGGYGCIFRPALRCKGARKRKRGVSKLMTKEHAATEYATVTNFLDKLKEIPNYSRYFVVDGVSVCEPAPLTSSDLRTYDDVCSVLAAKGFTRADVNSRLTDLRAMRMPDAGMDLAQYIDEHPASVSLVKKLNRNIADLLENAIVPMNRLGVLHMDVKASNIMVGAKTNRGNFKLVDWGVADVYDGRYVPLQSTARPVQYNIPFTAILLNDAFPPMYAELLRSSPGILDGSEAHNKQLDAFIINFYFHWQDIRGPGHHQYIESLCRLFVTSELGRDVPFDEVVALGQYCLYDALTGHISRVLKKYTKGDVFDVDRYFNEVYSKNVDVWGLVMSYETLLTRVDADDSELTDQQRRTVRDFVAGLVTDYLYGGGTAPIDVKELVRSMGEFDSAMDGPLRAAPTRLPRCKKGTRRDRRSHRCLPKHATAARRHQHRRCPAGTRRNRHTRKCDPKTGPRTGRDTLLRRERLPSGVRELLTKS